MRPFNAPASGPVPAAGWWESSITPEMIAAGAVAFSDLQVDGGTVYWLEQRPHEGGRRVLLRWSLASGAGAEEVLPPSADVGTRVHEYGGGGFAVDAGTIVYSQRNDGSVWAAGDGAPRPLVAVPGCRYAAFAFDRARGRVYAVREDHRDRPPASPANAVVALLLEPADPAANAGDILFAGTDFVLAPQLSPGGDHVAFVGWNQPAMPFDATQLFVLDLAADGTPGAVRVVAGADGSEAIVAAAWSPAGALIFASDRTQWWNLYAARDGKTTPLAPVTAEIGEPPWVFGRRPFAPLGDRDALCVAIRDGVVRAARIADGALTDLPFGAVDTTPLPYDEGAVFIAVPADAPASIRYAPSLASGASQLVRATPGRPLAPGDVSIGEYQTLPAGDGETTHVVYYPPRNAHARLGPDERPPLIVMSHGGPTAMHTGAYDLGIARWTTRGFAVAHVNYRGSSGFGRPYRKRLDGAWGEIDVSDCISAAAWCAAGGRCDPARIVIRGGSSSGMTALLALARSDIFAAATSSYGVMDLLSLAATTHKFEARYVDAMIGPLPAMADRYRERSPVNNTATIRAPVLLLQGLDDRVVPPDQATRMRDALAARGVRVVFETFAGEGHGFRAAETMRRAFELELDFYRDVFSRL